MSFLDEVKSKAAEALSGQTSDQTSGLLGGVLEMVKNQPGGLPGLVQTFHDKGLGGIVNSWISTGQNLPISAEQIEGVLGSDQVKQIAAQVGVSPDVASSKLAELLPTMIDKLTPDGKLPEGGNLLQQALGFFSRRS